MVGACPLKLSVTNCFLVKAGDHYVLIDTGYVDEWELFRRRLTEKRLKLSQISHIILTHHHNDHCGLLHNILQRYDSIPVVMSHRCKDLLSEGKNDLANDGGFLNRRMALFMMFGVPPYLSWHLKTMMISEEKMETFPPYKLRSCDIVVTGDTGLRDIGIPLDGKLSKRPGIP
jgi:glyoxylase-like metal-dependent hydrolase (beta-lactamase superfamily II)